MSLGGESVSVDNGFVCGETEDSWTGVPGLEGWD